VADGGEDTHEDGSLRVRSHWPLSLLSGSVALITLAMPLVLVRILEPAEIGAFKVFFLYLTIVPAFALTSGITSGLAYWSGQGERREVALHVSGTLMLCLGFTFMVGAVILEPLIARLTGWVPLEAYAFGIALLGGVAGGFFEEAAIVSGRLWRGACFHAGFELLRAAVMIGTAITTRSLVAVLMAHAVLVTIKVVVGYALAALLGAFRLTLNPIALREVLSYALPVSIAWVFGIFVLYADQAVLSAFVSRTEFAFYAIGCLAIPPLFILEQSVVRVLLPQLSQAFSEGRTSDGAWLYRTAVHQLAFLLIPAVMGLITFAEPIIDLLFTATYASSAAYLQLFALTYLFLMLPYDAVPRARGEGRWILRTFVLFSIVALGVTTFLTRGFGPFGALTALLCTGAGLRVWAGYYITRTTEWRLREFLPLPSIGFFGVVAIGLAFPVREARALFVSDLHWFLVAGSGFALVYLLIAFYGDPARREVPRGGERVLIVTQTVAIGGLERMVLQLCSALRAVGVPVQVFAYAQPPGAPGLAPEFSRLKIPLICSEKPERFSCGVVFRIVRLVSGGVSVIHTHDIGGLIYTVLARPFLTRRVRIVHTQHSFIHLERNRRYALYERIFTRFVDQVTVVSPDTRETYRTLGFDTGRMALIRNGVPFEGEAPVSRRERIAHRRVLLQHQANPVLDHLKDAVWIISLARLDRGKGQDTALEVWGALPASARSRAALLFVGPEAGAGERARLKRLISLVPDGDRVALCGPTNEPLRWLRAADIYLSCSRFEGMPLGPVEAIGEGLPALLSRIPGHEFLASVSSIFELRDIAGGAEELTRLIEMTGDPVWEGECRVRATLVREQFSIDEMAGAYRQVYGFPVPPGGAILTGAARP